MCPLLNRKDYVIDVELIESVNLKRTDGVCREQDISEYTIIFIVWCQVKDHRR